MTRMTGPDCAVMCNLINIRTYIHTEVYTYIHTYIHTYVYIHARRQGGEHKVLRAQVRFVQVERVCLFCRV